jgi:alpha,alpha-trehalase
MSEDWQAGDGGWSLVYDHYDPDEERRRESLCALGNGYFAVRGAAAESTADGTHDPGTYVAGLYNRLVSDLGEGRRSEDESLVRLPNWLALSFRIDEAPWFALDEAEILEYRQTLDLCRGILRRTVRFRDADGRMTRYETEVIAHLRLHHIGLVAATITAENWSGSLALCSRLDGRVRNCGVAAYEPFNDVHLEGVEGEVPGPGALRLAVRTVQSQIDIALAAHHVVRGPRTIAERSLGYERAPAGGCVALEYAVRLEPGESFALEKTVALVTSRDPVICEAREAAERWLAHAMETAGLRDTHDAAWSYLWEHCDLDAALPERDRLALRVHVFHVLQTASLKTADVDAGIPSRGWSGEGYRGRIFWDELFVYPLLTASMPEIARSLLLYRYRRLPEARRAACSGGHAGAMYPWQSGSDGSEATQRYDLNPRSGRILVDHTHRAHHVGAAIAYNVWQFDQMTGDRDFLHHYGAEMLLEIARFWASLAHENPARGRYEIHGVIGPDEFQTGHPGADEPGLRNNAYTNVMAAWVLARALELLERLPPLTRRELCALLHLENDELARWDAVSRRLYVPFHDGVISQFEGYEQLSELDWDGYRARYGEIRRLDRILEAEGESPNRYRAAKQADVLMLFFLFTDAELEALMERLGYRFDASMRRRTVDYYATRTTHGSTLSPVVHAWIYVREGRFEEAVPHFRSALATDLADVDSTPEGIHLGAMAGTVDLVQRGFTGLRLRADALELSPCLPPELPSVAFGLRYRGAVVQIRVTGERTEVEVADDAPHAVRVRVRGTERTLEPGCTGRFANSPPGRA